ncbi:MAG: VCBS repeat-containing protein [Phycisphaerales bacterium]|nr:VCBS repeat-containing protein [Phycisphaerales bacterium]
MQRFSAGLVLSLASSALAQPVFVDRTADLGLTLDNGVAAWGDVNDDGWPDLCNAGAIWINREGKSFERAPAPTTGLLADIDADGDADLVCFAPVAIFRNTAAPPGDAPNFEPVALPELPATSSVGAAAADFNADGLLDVYIGGFEGGNPQATLPDLLLLSNGLGGFTLAMDIVEFRARGVTACDFDEDHDIDIYVSNYRLQPNVLWVNDGQGGMSNCAADFNVLATSEGFLGGHSIGACFADFDRDGHFDLFAGNFAHVDSRGDQPKSRFLRNLGPEHAWKFDDLHECGVWYQESYASPAAGDFDNDGLVDLLFTTVYADASFGRKNYPVLYRNQSTKEGGWKFVDVTEGSGLERLPPTYQAAWADFDRDGDLDLVTAGRLFVNQAPADRRWIEVRLVGDAGPGGRQAVGAQVRLIGSDDHRPARQVEIGTGQGNANSPFLHFGLGDCGEEVSIEVVWPDGNRQVEGPHHPNQLVTITRNSRPESAASSRD